MSTPSRIATERVFVEGPDGVSRLVAAPGDVIPATVPAYGFSTVERATVIAEPFAGYDALSEAEVLERLPSLAPEELSVVRDYEAARLARGSITRWGVTSSPVRSARQAPRAPLPAASTSEGWDGVGVEELRAEADRRGLRVHGTGSGGNVVKADLVRALQADDGRDGAPL